MYQIIALIPESIIKMRNCPHPVPHQGKLAYVLLIKSGMFDLALKSKIGVIQKTENGNKIRIVFFIPIIPVMASKIVKTGL